MTGYRIIQPSGYVKQLNCETEEQKAKAVDEQLSKWSDYCNRNWLSDNHEDMFCPERKVKLFQNGLAYYLLIGADAKGIVTDYKDQK